MTKWAISFKAADEVRGRYADDDSGLLPSALECISELPGEATGALVSLITGASFEIEPDFWSVCTGLHGLGLSIGSDPGLDWELPIPETKFARLEVPKLGISKVFENPDTVFATLTADLAQQDPEHGRELDVHVDRFSVSGQFNTVLSPEHLDKLAKHRVRLISAPIVPKPGVIRDVEDLREFLSQIEVGSD